MRTQLLIAIRKSKTRLEPAIKRQETNYPYREIFFRYLRLVAPLREIPIQIGSCYKVFLDGPVQPNSKAEAVYREFISAGKYLKEIWYPNLYPPSSLLRFLRVFIRIPWLILFLSSKRKTLRCLDLVALQVVIGYVVYQRFFRKHENLFPIIISDISPILHMQWSAALSIGRKVIWWQDDYHHYKGFSAESYMPYPADLAIVLNQKGLETVQDKNPSAHIYRRSCSIVYPLKPIPEFPKVGIATNAFFQASSEQLQHIDKIRKDLGIDKVYFRLHPNSKLTKKELGESWMELTPSNEVVAEFSQKIDLVLVGNSAVQLKLLCLGTPVVHIAGLDAFSFDLYGYCKEGFCYGIKKSDSVSLKEVSKFYQNSIISNRLNHFVNVQSEIPELLEIAI